MSNLAARGTCSSEPTEPREGPPVMRKSTFQFVAPSGAFPCPGYLLGNGLILHRPACAVEGVLHLSKMGWQPSHALSGRSLCARYPYPTRKSLLHALEKSGLLALDFHKTVEQIEKDACIIEAWRKFRNLEIPAI